MTAASLVTPLSAQQQDRLNKVLGQWRRWTTTSTLSDAPHVVTHLPAGSGHRVVLVQSGLDGHSATQHFVIRFAHRPITRPGYQLTSEANWMLLAHQQQLAPAPVFVDILNDALVMDYIPQRIVPISAVEIGQLLDAIHQLPAKGPSVDLKAIYVSYLKWTGALSPPSHRALIAPQTEQAPKIASQCALLSADDEGFNRCLALLSAGPQCLCHNDLTRGNIINSPSGIVAIDWEYAGIGSPWFDIAAALADISTISSEAPRKAKMTGQATSEQQVADRLAIDRLPTAAQQARQQLLDAAGTKVVDAPLLTVAEAVYDTLAYAWKYTQNEFEDPAPVTDIYADYECQQAETSALALRLRNAANSAESAKR